MHTLEILKAQMDAMDALVDVWHLVRGHAMGDVKDLANMNAQVDVKQDVETHVRMHVYVRHIKNRHIYEKG